MSQAAATPLSSGQVSVPPLQAGPVMPRHVAVIMDGNGRWAKARKLPRSAGHKQGAEALRDILSACRRLGVKHLTVYAFSAENWQRPKAEVNDLFGLLKIYLRRELAEMKAKKIRLRVIGELDLLPADMREQIVEAEKATAENHDFDFTVCFSYGARQEIVSAVRRLAADVAAGKLDPAAIDEARFAPYLYTSHLPEPDLLIRTGGEKRLSNFLLWQTAYTELYFSDVLWPDFTERHFEDACRSFSQRERRYGLTE